MTDIITLPWPDRELSPNARLNWHAKAGVVAQAQQDGRILALANKLRLPADKPLQMTVVFRPPSRRHYDMDNLLASMKATLDGLVEAAGANDNQIKRIHMDMDDACMHGQVQITFEVIDGR